MESNVLTKEEKKKKIRDHIVKTSKKRTYKIEEFSISLISQKTHIKEKDVRSILNDLVADEKVIFKKHIKFYAYLPNNSVGKSIKKNLEGKIKISYWVDDVQALLLSLFLIVIGFNLVSIKKPIWLDILLAGWEQKDYFLAGIFYGAAFVIIFYLVIYTILSKTRVYGKLNSILFLSALAIVVFSIYLISQGKLIIFSIIMAILSTLASILSLFRDWVVKKINPHL